jgi:hypothetical protein
MAQPLRGVIFRSQISKPYFHTATFARKTPPEFESNHWGKPAKSIDNDNITLKKLSSIQRLQNGVKRQVKPEPL